MLIRLICWISLACWIHVLSADAQVYDSFSDTIAEVHQGKPTPLNLSIQPINAAILRLSQARQLTILD